MERIKQLSVSPAFEAALIEFLGAELQRPRRFFTRPAVALLVGLTLACVALAVALACFIHR